MNVNKSTVTKVANAIKKGQVPPQGSAIVVPPPPPGDDAPDDPGAGEGQEGDVPAGGVKPGYKPPAPPGQPKPQKQPVTIDASILLLRPVPTSCALTPIMVNARYTAIKEFNWPSDIAWEDFFDTCLVWLFHYWGWGLQGAYQLDEKEKQASPKAASEKAEGDGHMTPAKLKEAATKIGMMMLDIVAQTGKEGTTTKQEVVPPK